LLNGARFLGEDQKSRLENILGIVPVVQHAAADAQDHGAVPLYQGGEGGFLMLRGEAFDQLPVWHLALGLCRRQLAEVSQDDPGLCACHSYGSSKGTDLASI
jgi:hypothetical protein